MFLSSQDLGNYADVAANLAGKNKKAAYIKNSQDDKPAEERNFSTPVKKQMFAEVGLELEEVDLREYFGNPTALKDKLKDFGSVWCAGGNTFILRRAMKASGFDQILIDMLKKDEILYGGWSAGACVATPSLRGLETDRADFPNVVPQKYPSEIFWDGLNLVQFYIVPHFDTDWFAQQANALKHYYEQQGLPYRLLKDGQAIVINGDKEELLK